MLLLLSKYRMKSLPVVDNGEGLHWFEEWLTKTLSEIGLPIMRLSKIIKV
jgi:hypothetical protein